MSTSAVHFWTHVSFWSYVVGNGVEMLLWFEPYYNKSVEEVPVKASKAPSVQLDDIKIED